MIDKNALHRIHLLFNTCAPLFIALGDEVRQKLILDIADNIAANGEDGINVTNLSAKSNLSRPAISHHLKVLKDCGLVRPVKKGTQIFYQLTLDKNLEEAADLVKEIQDVMAAVRQKTN